MGLRVLIDHQIFTIQTFGGISRVFTELHSRFQEKDSVNSEIPIVFSENEYIAKALKTRTLFKGKNFFLKTLLYYFVNRLYCSFKLLKGNFDVFIPTYYDPYFLPFLKGKPFVLCIHDMTHEIFPESVSIKDKTIKWKRKLVYKANKIIAISENTKKDIVKLYGIDKSKIEVVYWATSIKVPREKPNLKLPDRYVLYVGNRSRYKNFNFFFESVAPILEKDKDLHLLCAGSSSFTDQEKELFKKYGVLEQVIHLRFKNDDKLASIYNNALCFVFPSLYEGFGIPVLESFACDCPTVISNSSSLPEVGGGAVEYFVPENKESIQKAIQKVIYNKELRKRLVSKGRERLKRFNWEKTADELIEVYKEALY